MLGIQDDLIWFGKMVSIKIAMKRTGFLGADPRDDKEVTCMNRLIRWNIEEDRIEWECDLRHSQITMEQLNLKEDRASAPPECPWTLPHSAPLNARERTVQYLGA